MACICKALDALVRGTALGFPHLSLAVVEVHLRPVLFKLAHGRGANTSASRDPELAKDATGMEQGHEADSADDERSLKDHEGWFVVGQMAVEATPKLSNTIDGSDEDANSGDEQTYFDISDCFLKKVIDTYSTGTNGRRASHAGWHIAEAGCGPRRSSSLCGRAEQSLPRVRRR